MSKVSIIVPHLNTVKYVREMMESVINQTLKEIEILIVDAGSTDGSLEIFQEYAAKDGRIKIIHSDRKSMGYQYNIGMDAATSEYIGFVEPDDYIDLNMFEDLYENMHGQNIDLIKTDFDRFIDLQEKRLSISSGGLVGDKKSVFYGKVLNANDSPVIISLTCGFVWNGIYSKKFITDNNIRFNETPGAAFQDFAFYMQTIIYAKKIMYLNTSFYRWRQDNNASSILNPNAYKFLIDEFKYLLKCLENHSSVNINKFKPDIGTVFFRVFCLYLTVYLYKVGSSNEFL